MALSSLGLRLAGLSNNSAAAAPRGPELLKALGVVGLVDTLLQHCVDIGDCAFGLADRGVGPLYQDGGQRGPGVEAMVLSCKRVDCSLQVGRESLPQVEELKYLRVLFTSEGKMEREIDR